MILTEMVLRLRDEYRDVIRKADAFMARCGIPEERLLRKLDLQQ